MNGGLREELELAAASQIIGSVGRLVKIKDFPLLIRSFAQLHIDDAHLVIVGDGDERQTIEAAVAEYELEGRGHLLGWRYDVGEIMQSFDVLALTSKNEGTPVAIIEAMAAGTPVVATDVGGVADLLEQGSGGELVRSRSETHIAEAIRRALEKPKSDMQSRQRIVEDFGPQRLVDRLEQVMRERLDLRNG